jgi:hypothetical protein
MQPNSHPQLVCLYIVARPRTLAMGEVAQFLKLKGTDTVICPNDIRRTSPKKSQDLLLMKNLVLTKYMRSSHKLDRIPLSVSG